MQGPLKVYFIVPIWLHMYCIRKAKNDILTFHYDNEPLELLEKGTGL